LVPDRDVIAELRFELSGSEGSFLAEFFRARWDRARFHRLACLLSGACRELDGAATLDRELASGVWFLVTQLTARARAQPYVAQHPREYLDSAVEQVNLLASWFFDGDCPLSDPDALDAEIDALGSG
jgi:hypothetical protein